MTTCAPGGGPAKAGGKPGSGGPAKAGGKPGSGGPGKVGGLAKAVTGKLQTVAQNDAGKLKIGSGGPKISGGAKATITRTTSGVAITDNWGALVDSLFQSGQSGQTGNAGQTAGTAQPQDIQALKEDIARALGKPAGSIGAMFKETAGAKWSVADLLAIKDFVEKIPPADRAAIANTTFERTKALPSEDGRPNYGHVEF